MKATGSSSWLSPAQAALELKVTPERVRQMLRSGVLRYERTPLGRLIDPQSVLDLERQRAASRGGMPSGAKGEPGSGA